MRLVDSSAWIEWLTDSPLADAIDGALPARDEWLVPTIVQLELAKWLLREKGEEAADKVLAFSETCQVAALDSKIALAAAEICLKRKLATADAIVYATAQAHGADILTCDAHFDGLPHVALIRNG
ncbi:MAG: type II toxin-antitoxin system VapC family toxin [Elsteraceae bacterium]